MTGPSNGGTGGAAGETILVAVRNPADESRGQANLAEDVGSAEGIVRALVESGVKPELVSALEATERPLTVSYEWAVEIGGKHARRPRSQRTPTPATTQNSLLSRANEALQDILPEAPFQLRFDRLVWLALWGASLLVLGILLVASLSAGSSREFVIGGQGSPANETVGSNVTARPTISAQPSASPGGSAAAPLPSCLQGSVNNCQCQDFSSQSEAQKFFTTYPPPNRQPIDPDGDGLVCEWLPKITASPRS